LAGRAAGGDFPTVVLDDALADREAETGAAGLAVRGEGRAERPGNFGGEAAAGNL
jgi:hypothetical protein